MIKAKEFLKDARVYYSNNLISEPEISVIMPTYCRGNNGLLERAIESVLTQSFEDFELIIVDDGSVDRTREIIEKLIKRDNRIIYIRNEINSGLPGLRVNQGIKESRGKYIAYEFDDDMWLPNFLKDLYDEIKKKKEPCLVYGRACVFNTVDQTTEVFNNKPSEEILKTRNLIANNSVLHSKELCRLYGMYDMHVFMRRACDWDLWKRWINKVKFYLVDKTVCNVETLHNNSVGNTCEHRKILYELTRIHERNEKLNLDNFYEYEVDDINFIEDPYIKEIAYQYYILPFRLRHRRCINEYIVYSINSTYSKKCISNKTLVDEKSKELKKVIGQDAYICYVIDSSYLGEAAKQLVSHAVLSKKYGLNVLICLDKQFKGTNCEVYKVCKSNYIKIYYLDYDIYASPDEIVEDIPVIKGRDMLELFKHANAKIIHSCTFIPSLKLISNKLNIPYVASIYEIVEHKETITEENKLKYLPDIVHSDSLKCANQCSRYMRVYSKCIRCHISKKLFNENKDIGFGKERLDIIASDTIKGDNYKTEVIEAIAMLRNQGIYVNLRLPGFYPNEYREKYVDLINKYSLQDQVKFVDDCIDMENEMRHADILLCFSVDEAPSQVVLEAMAKKLVVISTPVAEIQELIIDGVSGYLCNGYHKESVVNAVKRVIYDFKHNKNKVNMMLNYAFDIVFSECNEYRVAYELFLLYKTALKINCQRIYGSTISYLDDSIDGNKYIENIEDHYTCKRYVPQDIGLKAGKKIRFNKGYMLKIKGKIFNELGVYFGTYGKVIKGTMIIKIKSINQKILREHKYDMRSIEDNVRFIIDISPCIEDIENIIIEFNFIYAGRNTEISIYERKNNELYFETNYSNI